MCQATWIKAALAGRLSHREVQVSHREVRVSHREVRVSHREVQLTHREGQLSHRGGCRTHPSTGISRMRDGFLAITALRSHFHDEAGAVVTPPEWRAA